RLGRLRRRMRPHAHVPAVRGDALFAGNGGERGFSSHAGPIGQLVSRGGASAGQFLLAALPTVGAGGLGPPNRLAAGSVRLAAGALARGSLALPLAAHLVVRRPRSSARGCLDFTRGAVVPGNNPGEGGREIGASAGHLDL